MKLEDAVKAAKDGAQAIGQLLIEVCKAAPQAREVIEADLDVKEMGLDKCYGALKEHARKNQKGGFWGCPVVGVDPQNEVVQVVLGFYKVPVEWIGGEEPETQALVGRQAGGLSGGGLGKAVPTIDLLDLL